jgi:hypothetical protein
LLAATSALRCASAWVERTEPRRLAVSLMVASLSVMAITKVMTVNFNPFLYFRF